MCGLTRNLDKIRNERIRRRRTTRVSQAGLRAGKEMDRATWSRTLFTGKAEVYRAISVMITHSDDVFECEFCLVVGLQLMVATVRQVKILQTPSNI